MDHGGPHHADPGDEEEAGGSVEVVDPARDGVLPGGEDDARPDDADGELPPLRHDELLRQGLGEGVGVGSLSYQHLGEGLVIKDLGVQSLEERERLAGLHGRRVGPLLDVGPLTVTVGGGHVDQRHQLLHLLTQSDDEGDRPDVHDERLAEVFIEPDGGGTVEHDLCLQRTESVCRTLVEAYLVDESILILN